MFRNIVFLLFISTIPVKNVYSKNLLTIHDCIKIALENATSIQLKKNDLILSEAKLKRSYAGLFPTIEAGAEYIPYNKQHNYGLNQFGYSSDENAFFKDTQTYYTKSKSEDYSYYIRSNLNIFNGLSSIASIKSDKHEKTASNYALHRTKESIVYDILQLYYQLLLDKELLKISEQNLKNSQNVLKRIRQKVKLGDLSISDQYRQEAKVSTDEVTVLERKNNISIDKIALFKKMGINHSSEYTFADIIVDTKNLQESIGDKDDLILIAFKKRTDLKSAQESSKSIKNKIIKARSDYYPKIDFVFEMGSSATVIKDYYLENTKIELPKSLPIEDQLFDNIDLKYIISLRWKIFDGLTTSLAVQESKINYLNSRLYEEDLKREIISEIQTLIINYIKALKQIESTEKGLKSAKKAYETISARYELGLSDFIDLSDSQTSLLEAQSLRAQAIYNYGLQRQVVSHFTGTLDLSLYE